MTPPLTLEEEVCLFGILNQNPRPVMLVTHHPIRLPLCNRDREWSVIVDDTPMFKFSVAAGSGAITLDPNAFMHSTQRLQIWTRIITKLNTGEIIPEEWLQYE